MRIAVCSAQVPFARGGTEVFVDDLVAELRKRDHEAELVTVPYKWYPGTRVLTQAFLWRLLDLTEAEGRPIDLVIATKFPTYAVRHPNKVVWLLHQFRQAYELDRTELGQFSDSPEDRATRRAVQALDRRVLGEASKLFTTSRNNQQRLESSTGLVAEVLPHPPQELPYRCEDYGDFVLSVGRLDRAKRVDLLIEAAAESSFSVVVAGDGPDRGRLEELAGQRSLDGRVRFLGRVSEDELADLYARCLAVFYAPVDEDFGMVPYEAFLADKPVVTTVDAGGPLEVVADRKTGIVCEPRAAAVADACVWLREHLDQARSFGRAGHALADEVTWDRAIERISVVRVAYYSPLPPERSGIADYSALLLPALKQRMDVEVARPRRPPLRRPTSRSTTSGTTRRRTAGSWTRCAGAPASSSSTTSSSTTSSPG